MPSLSYWSNYHSLLQSLLFKYEKHSIETKRGKKEKKDMIKKRRYKGEKGRETRKKIKKDREKALQKGEEMVV